MSKFHVIEKYLGLSEPLKHDKIDGEDFKKQNQFEESDIVKAEDRYERYFYYLNNFYLNYLKKFYYIHNI